ncbi:MAG: ribosomal protein S18-alanine N-acetyltransferase [Lachnospiraceae bacterium]|nr:ribosomal protein S18-alanine N-acetyltransferase [Lachnospiraceae bacterium]
MLIRSYEKKDFDAILELDRMCFHDAWSVQNWKETLKMQQYRCFVVEEESPRGFLLVSTATDEGEILKIGVAVMHRGKSYGMELLKEAFRHWRIEGVKNIFLEVRASNDSAISLYEKVGFQKIGRRKNYYKQPKEDAIVYSLQLGMLEDK